MTKVANYGGSNLDVNGASSDISLVKRNVLVKTVLLVESLALVLTIVVSAVPNWITHTHVYLGDIRVGIFYSCDDIYDCDGDTKPADWQKAAAGLHATAMTCGLGAVVLMVIQLVKCDAPWTSKLKYLSCVCSWLAGITMLAALMVHQEMKDDVPGLEGTRFDIAWAFVLSCANSGFFIIGSLILTIHAFL